MSPQLGLLAESGAFYREPPAGERTRTNKGGPPWLRRETF
jgi:hypothetical protein